MQRSPRRLLVVLGAVTLGSAMSLSWLGWKLLQQDADLEAQRQHERLEFQADRVEQTLERQLADVEVRLDAWLQHPPRGAPAFGTGLVLTAASVDPIPPATLSFYPVLPPRRAVPASLFLEAERLEYQDRDYVRAAQVLRALSRSTDPATRAAALVHLGRVQRTAGDTLAALATYAELQKLDDVTVLDLPAELVARAASARLQQNAGRVEAARLGARAILTDLTSGRWRLTRGQYESYVDDLGPIAQISTPPSRATAIALAASQLWNDLHAAPSDRADRGRRLIRTSAGPVLALYRRSSDTTSAWLADPAAVLGRLDLAPDLAVTLADADGPIAATANPLGTLRTVRAGVDSGLPWTMHVSQAATPTADRSLQRTLVVSGLVLMVVFLVAGAFFIGRAIRQTTELARAQSDFVAAVSHEFRTPLASMRQLSELLAEGRVSGDDKRQHYYESLAGESRRLQKLVENLLNFGRLEAGARPFHLESVDLRELVSGVVDDYRTQIARPDCRIEIDERSAPAVVRADRDAVALALHNLLDNAVKYAGGAQPVRVGWTVQGDRVALSVKDQGPGISLDEQRLIFQRFVRGAAADAGHVRGTGIGLAMVKLVATSHGGDVVVDSQLGVGSTFTLLLPLGESA